MIGKVSTLFSPLQSLAPAGERIYAVGDIHGRLDLLKTLMDKVEQDAEKHEDNALFLVFLGDYIDRGPFSRQLIDYLLAHLPASDQIVYLRGNHENFLLRFLDGEDYIAHSWLRYGGTDTLLSYGLAPPDLRGAWQARLREAMLKAIDPAHVAFMREAGFSYERGDYFFAHAGVNPLMSLEKQDPTDLMEIRGEFLASNLDYGKIVVHGHTVTSVPDIRPNRIGIDTGAYATGHLTCLVLHQKDRYFLAT
jgi:serine/threonine protein phosphatase 1